MKKGRGDIQIEGKISTIKLTQAHEKEGVTYKSGHGIDAISS